MIGHGATQVLAAAIMSTEYDSIYCRPPYFFRFPDIATYAGKRLTTTAPAIHLSSEIVVHPTNPDCVFYEPQSVDQKIFDLCYNWPTYVTPVKYDEDIMIFGLSKATGHAGTRIGWALVRDEQTYHRMTSIIEFQSGGISRDAQYRAERILANQNRIIDSNIKSGRTDTEGTIFEYGRDVLNTRWKKIQQISNKNLKPTNSAGMFLYTEYGGSANAAETLLLKYGITGTPGSLVGDKDSRVRINIGCSQSDFDEFLRRMESE